MALPVISIVGAPNVGKSTLFNRLLGKRRAIVSDQPGVTRDRIGADCDLFGRSVRLVDTGGVVVGETDDLTRRVRAEAMKAVGESDLILFVVDARAGLTSTEHEVALLLRGSGKKVLIVANKVDAASLDGIELDLYRLGLGEVVAVSSEQGRGLDELIDRIREMIPAQTAQPEPEAVPIAIIGRPNVGKSSLFNRLVRAERALVAPAPGTTRDPIDAAFTHRGDRFRIIDTAGMRRRARRGEEVEWISVLKARQMIQTAEITIALVDGSTSIEHQDLSLMGLVSRQRAPVVLAVNKIDLLPRGGSELRDRLQEVREALRFSSHVPVVALSALTGEGVNTLLQAVHDLREEIHRRFTTAELNQALTSLLEEKQPPSDRGKPVRFYYMTQIGGPPPRFALFGNGRRVDPSYRRFMESRLRQKLGLDTAPVVIAFRGSRSSR